MATKGRPKWINWQQPMKNVLIACAPLMVAAIYFFGWRVLAMATIAAIAGYITEAVFTRRWNEPVTSAVFVSSVLFTFSLPPTLPFWIAVVGIIFGILFGKMVYGGFGRNIFNPALTGRAFIYISFGKQMTGAWYTPWTDFPGGFAKWGWTVSSAAKAKVDVITTATPGSLLRMSAESLAERGVDLSGFKIWDFLFGNCAGVIGGTSAILIIICGLYLLWKKTSNYRIVVSGFVGYAVAQTIFWYFNMGNALDPLHAVVANGVLLGIFFYATDPVTASQTNPGRWYYGAFVGVMSSVIATFSAWPAGTMFAVLLGNMFAPIADYAIRMVQQKRAVKAVAA